MQVSSGLLLQSLFSPSSEELQTKITTLVYLMNDFYPSDVTVAWKADAPSVTQSVESTQPSKHMASIYSTLTASQ
jgi:hypothetical protein